MSDYDDWEKYQKSLNSPKIIEDEDNIVDEKLVKYLPGCQFLCFYHYHSYLHWSQTFLNGQNPKVSTKEDIYFSNWPIIDKHLYFLDSLTPDLWLSIGGEFYYYKLYVKTDHNYYLREEIDFTYDNVGCIFKFYDTDLVKFCQGSNLTFYMAREVDSPRRQIFRFD